MTVGPYGASFGGTLYDPSTPPAVAGGAPLVIPQTQLIVADLTTRAAILAANPNPGNGRLLRRVVVQGPAGNAWLYAGDPTNPQNRVDGTAAGDFDVAEYDPPLFIQNGLALTLVWDQTITTAGSAWMRAEWTDV